MEWRKITPDESQRADGQVRVRLRQRQQREERKPEEGQKWDIEQKNGDGWDRLPIPPCATKEEAIDKANVAIVALG